MGRVRGVNDMHILGIKYTSSIVLIVTVVESPMYSKKEFTTLALPT